VTITILCAGALARPGTDADAGSTSTMQAPLPPEISDGTVARTLLRARVVSRTRQPGLVPEELPEEAWLRARFGLEGAVAACALPPGDPHAPDVLVRPVHLHLGLDHLVLAPPAAVALARAEADALAARANELIGEDGLALRVVQPDAWRLEAPSPAAQADLAAIAALLARSARMASGRSIDVYEPQGEAARRWRQLNNLVQMGWFEHAVNLAREAEGRLPVSGLWLEGGVRSVARRPFADVRATDPAVAGLALRAGVPSRLIAAGDEAAMDPSAWIEAAGPSRGEAVLLAPGFWQQAVGEGDPAAWTQAWQRFERWFAALAHARPAIAEDSLHWVLTGERSTVVLASTRGDRFRPWRRVQRATLGRDAARDPSA